VKERAHPLPHAFPCFTRLTLLFLQRNQPDAPMCQIYLFWNDTLHVSDGLSVHHQRFKTVHTAVSVWQVPVVVCTVLNSWWWTERPSETCSVIPKSNKFDTVVHVVGFTIGMILRCTALWTSHDSPWFFCPFWPHTHTHTHTHNSELSACVHLPVTPGHPASNDTTRIARAVAVRLALLTYSCL